MSGLWLHLYLSALLLVSAPILAADIDPPGRVGRLSLASEGIQLRIGDSVANGGAARNWPLTTGALLETATGARAEARIGSITLHLEGGTSLEFVELSDERVWLRLNRGSIILGIPNPAHASETALDTPQGRLRLDAPGSYRADVAGGTTAFSAYAGAAHIEEAGLSLRGGDRLLLLGGSDRSYLLGQAPSDAFRQWSRARVQMNSDGGTRYVSSEMTGYEELDRHGSWRETSEYGPVWFPRGMPPEWAPYRWGRWAWVSPWGWTWIDHAAWGFAPFHYGRWVLIGGSWAWMPGAYAAKPVYAPALIVWLGQPGWSASFSSGPAPVVGWFPLGPREIYHPYYRSSPHHARQVNAAHAGNASATPPPREGYRHIFRDRREAVTVVPEKTVLSGTPVNQAIVARDGNTYPTIPAAITPPAARTLRSVPALPPAKQSAIEPPVTEPQRISPQPRLTDPGPIDAPTQPSNGGSSSPAWRSQAVPRNDKPPIPPPPQPNFRPAAKEPMRPPSPYAAPQKLPSPPPAVIPGPQRRLHAATGGRNEGSSTTRIRRGNGFEKVHEPESRERRNPK